MCEEESNFKVIGINELSDLDTTVIAKIAISEKA